MGALGRPSELVTGPMRLYSRANHSPPLTRSPPKPNDVPSFSTLLSPAEHTSSPGVVARTGDARSGDRGSWLVYDRPLQVLVSACDSEWNSDWLTTPKPGMAPIITSPPIVGMAAKIQGRPT
ncbi:hypothetical protein V2G26_001543 [Clonostachys chloroleuca]